MKELNSISCGIPAAFLETWVNLSSDSQDLLSKERYGFFLINEVGDVNLAEKSLTEDCEEQVCVDGRFF